MEDLCVHRVRVCEGCGAETPTVEAHTFDWAESKADRCPHCIIGPGTIKTTSYRWNRERFWRKGNAKADAVGAVIRKRWCRDCDKTWTTYETLASGEPCGEVSVCHKCKTGARTFLARGARARS
jgi:hypothetical protein